MKVLCSFCFILSFLFANDAQAQVLDQMQHNGITREFYYYTPSTWNGTDNLPLLIVLHGLTQTAGGIMTITDFNLIAEANNFIVVYPDGINNAWNANMNVSVSQEDDLGFIEQLATHFQTDFSTNPLRQYLCGFSNGGFMSHKIACESSMCFAGIATVSGGMSDTVYQNCNPSHAPNILHIHGTLDAVVPYGGSITTGVSVDDMLEFWQNHLSCDLAPSFSAMPNPDLLDLSYPERYTYTNCTQGQLEHIKVIGGGHQWPGISTLVGGVGTINMDFYSPQEIWDFLDGRECPDTVNVTELENDANKTVAKIYDLLGRETTFKPNTPLLYQYSDGSVEKKMMLD
ncbi:MAG: PHB depolymerase family esterase [Crocinitomicaceae bacterium]|nr:PHB depolymerase family esterase [Crocinitomicaceae bacterium]